MLRRLVATLVGALLAVAGVACTSAWGAGTPAWQTVTFANPTAFSSESEVETNRASNFYTLIVSNVGGVSSNGGTITLTDLLPEGLSIRQLEETGPEPDWQCSEESKRLLSCASTKAVGSMGQLTPLTIAVAVSPSLPPDTVLTNSVTVAGGGAPTESATQATRVNPSMPLSFQPGDLTNLLSSQSGAPDTQAGDHPAGLATSFDITSVFANNEENSLRPSEDWKDVVLDLPAGIVGNPQVVVQCPLSEIFTSGGGGYGPDNSACPAGSQVGTIGIDNKGSFGYAADQMPIYNVVPERSEPAEFAFTYAGRSVPIYPTVVGQGAEAHIRVTTPGIPATAIVKTLAVYTKIFGDPGLNDGVGTPSAFFTNSSDCNGQPLVTTLHVDSWENPGSYNADGTPNFGDPAWKSMTMTSPPVTGCERLHFQPSLGVQTDTTQADEPTGLAVDLKVPQNPDPHGLGTPPVKDVTVTLPAGVSLSPSAADGLQACGDAQIDLASNTLGSCPDASVLGTVKVTTPLLAEPLTGFVFLGSPNCDPCSAKDASDGTMLRLFIQAEGSGIVVKVPGTVRVNTATGQLTAKFSEDPPFPFSDLQVAFKGGLRAGLATPQACGTFTATSNLEPWSGPSTPNATPSSSLRADWDGHGGACPASPPLTPSFSSGTSNPNAGQFSPLTLTFAREDRQQDLSQISVSTPPGLLGTLKGVPLCGEPQAAQGACSEASRIGAMTVAAGPGGHPFYTRGTIYLTTSYRGAPFGLSIVVPTVAGPFNLGNVVVRSQIDVDPVTAALTVTSDPLPQILDGIPLRLRTANVTIDRPGFIFNPTNCAQQKISATIAGVQGASVDVSAPFAVAGCAGLHFGPKFTVSTSAHTSRADGASLDAKVVFPPGAQSNIAKVKVDLPKQLPSRLTTLQKACPDATFRANPSACLAGSVIGIAKASTPVLPVTLTGPVYFVSHGGAKFPDLVVVLQGYGVRVDLTAETFISRKGITSSTFNSIPDVPVSSFELYLPQGKSSALAANGNLCLANLRMPTSFLAQDGAQLKQSTRIGVTGCARAKPRKAERKTKAKKASNRDIGNRRSK
jgi:hypothetical protein